MFAEPKVAVQSYIDALLFESTAEQIAGEAEELQELPGLKERSADSMPAASVQESLALAPANDIVQEQARGDATTGLKSRAFVRHLELAQQGSLAQAGQLRSVRSSRPEWAGERFRCVIAKVANLKLAIPAQFVSAVVPATAGLVLSEPEAGSGRDDDNSGSLRLQLIEHEGGKYQLLDSARLVMPERYAPAMCERYRHAIILGGTNCALAVDSLGNETEYQASKVRWRSTHTRRAWLAGTVIEDMCAVVDVDAIHRLLLADTVLGQDAGEAD